MAKWREKEPGRDHPEATAWVFYGDGQGNFKRREIVTGHGWHEARLADLDGDGDLDLLNKPYTWDAPRVDVWLNNGTRAGANGAGTSKSFHGPVGLQLYSLRETFAKHVPLGLQMTRGFGFAEVELAGTYGQPAAHFRATLQNARLQSCVIHCGLQRSWMRSMDQAIAEAKALGVRYLGTAGHPARRANSPRPKRARPQPTSTALAKRSPKKASRSSTTTMASSSCRTATAPCSICS